MTSDEIHAYNMGIKDIESQVEWMIHHFGGQLNGYAMNRLYAASYAIRNAVIDGETEG